MVNLLNHAKLGLALIGRCGPPDRWEV